MDVSSALISILVVVVATVYFFLKRKFSYFERHGIPHIKPESWILGNLNGVGRTIHLNDLLQKVYDNAKGKDVIAGFYALFSPGMVFVDLDLIKRITVKDFSSFTDRGVHVSEDEPLTGHLFAIGGEKWKFMRSKLSPTFTSGKMKLIYHTVSDKGVGLVKAIETESNKNGSIEMKNIANRFTIDVVSSAAFGMESNTLINEHPEFVDVFRKIFGEEGVSAASSFLLGMAPRLAKLFGIRMFDKSVDEFFFNVVGGNIKYRETNNIVRNDFLNMLIQLKNKGVVDGDSTGDPRKLTYDETIAQAFIFFFAGADTSSTAISYTMTELAYNPDIQERVRQEVSERTESSNGEITYENIHEMPYLNQVINESLRRFPPAFTTLRQCIKDYPIPGTKHVLKKGQGLMIPIYQIHHDEQYWKDPYTFNPDRFTTEEIAKRPNLAFLPFGEGPRNCIGMRFALVNVKFAVATMVKNFKFTLDTSKTKMPIKLNPQNQSISSIDGYWINFEKISTF
ncbi:probable cytochrome P450 6a13 [Bradysia coprophila]|uniref:probable cytochrome P450 6a13 n=1 Tax=Bradysia coprophila TaxID=38358 RepID=UPI00187DB649|nr:probable cytochrome P450 6a13 [Bradysia coprophila]